MNLFDDLVFLMSMDEVHNRTRQISMQRNYYGLQFVYQGAVIFDGTEYSAPCFFITAPGRTYNYGPSERTKFRSQIYICFTGSRVKQYLKEDLLSSSLNLHPVPVSTPQKLYARMKEILNLSHTPGHRSRQQAIAALDLLLLQLENHLEQRESLPPLFKSCRKLAESIQMHPENRWDFSAEARRLHISQVYFNRIFRRCLDFSPRRFLLECQLNKAADLLIHSNMQIREVAFACGFNDEFYFSRQFHKYRLFSPSKFRRNFG